MIALPRALGLAALASSPLLAYAGITPVPPGSTLQAAINAATSGDTLLLSDGSYNGCLTVPASMELRILGRGAARTTIACPSTSSAAITSNGQLALSGVTIAPSQRGLQIDAGQVQLQGVVINGGTTTGSGGGIIIGGGANAYLVDVAVNNAHADIGGGGIAVIGAETRAVLQSVTIDNAFAGLLGGGLFVSAAEVDARDVNVLNSRTGNNGGGMAVIGGAQLFFDSGSFVGNEAPNGGAVRVTADSTATLRWTTFDSNHASERGGAVSNLGNTTLDRVTLQANSASAGGAVFVGGQTQLYASLLVSNEALSDNPAALEGGGAIYVGDGGELDSRSNRFDTNSATFGGAIRVDAGSWAGSDDHFSANTAELGGAAFLTGSGLLQLSFQQFTANNATLGGAVQANDDAIVFDNGSLYTNNTSLSSGGAIGLGASASLLAQNQVATQNTATTEGGFLYAARDNLVELASGNYTANHSVRGGAIALWSPDPTAELGSATIASSTFLGNTALSEGGAIYAVGQALFVNNSRISHNEAGVNGGAIALSQAAESRLQRVVLCRNSAPTGGAVAAFDSRGPRSFNRVLFQSNTAEQAGGAFFERGAVSTSNTTTFSFVTVVDNDAVAGDHDGLVVALDHPNPTRINVTDSVLAFHDANAISVFDPALTGTSSVNVSGSLLWSNGGGAGVVGGPDPLDGTSALLNPNFDAWLATNDCAEGLRPGTSSANGGTFTGDGGVGVGVDAQAAGAATNPLNDADGDGVSPFMGDCNDNNADIYPGAVDIPNDGIDQDCLGGDLRDGDDDGYIGGAPLGLDCNDADPTIYPRATEVPYDGIDSDCDGVTNDADRDGALVLSANGDDCDDTDPTVGPWGVQIPYDGIDQSCGGDDADLDGDGFDAIEAGGDDCDDTNPEIYPGAPDTPYDGIDSDCAGNDDDDADGDGYLAIFRGGDDCDDTDPTINPGAEEIWYDGVDQDCDGRDDDRDNDGFGIATDCNDRDPTIYPGAPEIPDGKDNDCDGNVDPDSDGDGVLDYYELLYNTNPFSADTDNDGISDLIEWGPDLSGPPRDSDGDGTPDVFDLDSDNDGLPDAIEGAIDSDGDGLRDYRDPDDDNDTLPTSTELDGTTPRDTDGDGIPDHLDTDSDNDGIPDGIDPFPLDPGNRGDTVEAPPERPEKFGCGCSATLAGSSALGSTGSVAWLAGLLLLVAGRRRR